MMSVKGLLTGKFSVRTKYKIFFMDLLIYDAKKLSGTYSPPYIFSTF